jgi:hypothetical protein
VRIAFGCAEAVFEEDEYSLAHDGFQGGGISAPEGRP